MQGKLALNKKLLFDVIFSFALSFVFFKWKYQYAQTFFWSLMEEKPIVELHTI